MGSAQDSAAARPEGASGHRIAVTPTSSHIRVTLDGAEIADTTHAQALDETGIATRYYIPPTDVHSEVLQPSDTVTRCPFKGVAAYWSARVGDRVVADVAWVYDGQLRPDAEGVRGHYSFYEDRVSITVDGVPYRT